MKPVIVCLCGSTLYLDAFQEANYRETLAGNIVLDPGVFGHSLHQNREFDEMTLEKLHRAKIDLADEILVIDVGGYVGTSTRDEIVYAASCGKLIRYWSEREKLCPICSQSLERHEMPITERDTGGVIANAILFICSDCEYFEDESTRENFGKLASDLTR